MSGLRGFQRGVPLPFFDNGAQSKAAECPEEIPAVFWNILKFAAVLRREAPAELGVCEPLNHRFALLIRFIKGEFVCDQRAFQQPLESLQR